MAEFRTRSEISDRKKLVRIINPDPSRKVQELMVPEKVAKGKKAKKNGWIQTDKPISEFISDTPQSRKIKEQEAQIRELQAKLAVQNGKSGDTYGESAVGDFLTQANFPAADKKPSGLLDIKHHFEMKKEVDGMEDIAQLQAAHDEESGKEKPRKGVLKLIESRIEKLKA